MKKENKFFRIIRKFYKGVALGTNRKKLSARECRKRLEIKAFKGSGKFLQQSFESPFSVYSIVTGLFYNPMYFLLKTSSRRNN